MSRVDAIFAAVAPSLMGPFADAAEYLLGGVGDSVTLLAIDTRDAQAVGQSGLIELRHEIQVLREVITTPARGDSLTFTATGETFIVQQYEPDGPFWRLIVRKGGS